ncbi:Mss4-like protein [Jackrogersella minutella]|nr:Mss4-like protein [Jackrogersella minutella]
MFRFRLLPIRSCQYTLRRHNLYNTNLSSSSSLSPPASPTSQFHTTPPTIPPDQQPKTMPDPETSEWETQPPYRSTGDNAQFTKRWTAHCHCGRVRYWASRAKPLAAKFCHCVDCQALHGAPFQWAAVFEKADLHFERGADGLAFYHAPDGSTAHKLPCKVSCAYCHSPIMDEGRRMALVFPGIIEFGDAEHKRWFDPQCHIFYSQRVVDMHDGKPKWSGLDKQSELIKEVERHDCKENTVTGQPTNENTDN